MNRDLIEKFHQVAVSPKAQKDKYLAAGEKVVLTAPVYTPEEIIHSMGFVPMGAWGADIELNRAKEYFPAFMCSIVQSILELGMTGEYQGVDALVVPSLCDTLKCLGENWKYGVPSIPFIPMTYPQNRKPEYGIKFTMAGYERVIRDLEKVGGKFDENKLAESIKIYNRHNQVMRELDEILAVHPEVTAAQRSDIYKSAFFMKKEEHTALVEQLIEDLKGSESGEEKLPVIIHSRDASQDTFDIMKKEHAGTTGGVIHCFSGSAEMAKEYVKMGYYIGVGGVVTFKNSRVLKEVVKAIPLECIVVETDCPYLAPAPHRGKRNSSAYLPLVIEEIARLKEITAEEVENVTYENAQRLYGLIH